MVEFAVISIPLFLVLFGIFEYGRYVFILQMMENAAREGARFAVVNTFSPTVAADTQTRVRRFLSGVDVNAFGSQATINVFAADIAGNNLGSAQNAAFGTYICVQVVGDFRPITPNLFFSGSSFRMDIRALMNSEAN
ncbi:TadE-like protein OS=Singulisphaera acidiphila (strain ATCC BAA-1392 / DSM 18658 / VKM B-2454 / MOB10) GN=Sinac_7490 PE=4 SV=1: TadE [Tuwongella immobilis]|uniref:TadE-like domain-containing protein n=2 Tax=Tuwongella immobilis TaxID=692036 RepID=A0A6C2YHN0_9BACT|nr:TadE-like protein OS=Singulisphaera acidiphila (strain ATCC BAA-1392 / DSM 18658 / VKM B-2454 / MOB10) GN=Sinac_7490 PE=4 SV=1: TadE [Tuwongella immobilis]VTR97415.1 TadE-like protein OS=Singulisphaera acidiphila (strain ATCC BAA-1392 / DSM 18658 / VKM B-2454 / MOB10) GN=Sinac_7490 PE=4 SV=1: TadE [Tuwongella immobilis]